MDHTRQRLEIFQRILQSDPRQAGPEGLALMGIAELVVKGSDVMEQCLEEFGKKFNQEYNLGPRTLHKELLYRIDFMQEELDEYKKAVKSADMIAQYDALIDLMYLVAGTLYLQGLPIIPGFLEVHKSNMTKELCSPGKGKRGTQVMKTENFMRPNLRQIIEKAGVTLPTPKEKTQEPEEPSIKIPS